MHGLNSTRAGVGVYAKRLTEVLGEEQVTAIARRSGWLRRVRKVMPLAMVVAVLSTLGSGHAKWLADILRTFRKFAGLSLRYKPFHNRLAQASFPEMFRMLLEATVQKMSQPVLHAVSPKLSTFRDIVIHDGTSFALKDDLKGTWPGRFTKISPAAVELHVTMSLLQDDVRIVALAADKETERTYRPEAASLRERLFLADRGYEERKFFFDVDQAGGAFIVRGTKNIRPTIRAAFDSAGKSIPKLLGQKLNWDLLPAQTVDLDIEWLANSFVYRGRIVAIYKRGKRKVTVERVREAERWRPTTPTSAKSCVFIVAQSSTSRVKRRQDSNNARRNVGREEAERHRNPISRTRVEAPPSLDPYPNRQEHIHCRKVLLCDG